MRDRRSAFAVIPAQAGIQPPPPMDSGLRRNDGQTPE